MSELKERILRGVFMENDWKAYRIGNRKIYEYHYIDGEEHIYDYDENRMLTETEKRLFSIQMGINMKDMQAH